MTKGYLSARFGDFNEPKIGTMTHKERAETHKGYWMSVTHQGTRARHGWSSRFGMPTMPFKMYLRKSGDGSYGVWIQKMGEV